MKHKLRFASVFTLIAAVAIGALAIWWFGFHGSDPQDEAKQAGLTRADFPQSFDDYFKDMDGGIALTPEEIAGRNTWIVWTAGNQAFWDFLANNSFGAVDFLKTLSSYPGNEYTSDGVYRLGREGRFDYRGLMNEPGFVTPTGPDKYGLWLDQRVAEPEPFDEAVYGRASGVIGFRLFDNPAFDDEAKKNWDAEKYYTDPEYYLDEKLVRPYRVGMTCAICHVSFNPENPPDDPEHPQWENLSSNVGAQYFWIGRTFIFDPDESSYIWQLFDASHPGALDTSMVATDNIFGPRSMNAVYDLETRLTLGERETLDDVSLRLPGTTKEMDVIHVLKDGSDSVGALGALARVFVNIGEFHQQWIKNHNLLIGGKKQSPFPIEKAQKNSTYWNATEDRMENLVAFFLKASDPHLLKNSPGGLEYLSASEDTLTEGKIVFGENCAVCHSSKLPPSTIRPESDEYIDWLREAVLKSDFLDNNYLSNERRYPVTEIGTNSCAALATNAIEGHVWSEFSSKTFKELPAVGTIEVYNPFTESMDRYEMPGGGRGYYRVPSLISMWSTAPYLHNNALGKFTNDPSVAGRMEAYYDAIDLLLNPEKRKGVDSIYRTTAESFLVIHKSFIPKVVRPLISILTPFFEGDELRIGPIPKGTPIGLIANLDFEFSFSKTPRLAKTLVKVIGELKKIDRDNLNQEQATEILTNIAPDLLKLSKCPDFVNDRGHEYGSGLSDSQKQALIEYLKTF